ncbi:MAG: AAA family ATPase [Candidatus Levybacteria bacterium]|nr:AAA family ATPase [Candidatus Levybacteria bacterium]
MQNDVSSQKLLVAFVGMPGSGKSEATKYLREKGFASVRFGEVAEEGLKEMGLPLTPDNEQMYREKIRNELGMAAFAILSEEKIESFLKDNPVVVIDGLYSWEEYRYLLEKFLALKIIYVFASPATRYSRLAKRPVRPLTPEQARARDFAEIERLNKSGPIAMADFVIENNTSLDDLYTKIDELLKHLQITRSSP